MALSRIKAERASLSQRRSWLEFPPSVGVATAIPTLGPTVNEEASRFHAWGSFASENTFRVSDSPIPGFSRDNDAAPASTKFCTQGLCSPLDINKQLVAAYGVWIKC